MSARLRHSPTRVKQTCESTERPRTSAKLALPWYQRSHAQSISVDRAPSAGANDRLTGSHLAPASVVSNADAGSALALGRFVNSTALSR